MPRVLNLCHEAGPYKDIFYLTSTDLYLTFDLKVVGCARGQEKTFEIHEEEIDGLKKETEELKRMAQGCGHDCSTVREGDPASP